MNKRMTKRKSKIRRHQVESEGETSRNLQDRISSQVREAQKTMPFKAIVTDLTSVPRIASLPLIGFEWYTVSVELESPDSERYRIVLEIMHTLSMETVQLNDHITLEMYLNILVIMLPDLRPKLEKILKYYEYPCSVTTWDQNKVFLNLTDDVFAEIDEPEVDSHWLIAGLGVYFALIGKQLTSANYAAWMAGRVRAFSQSCGVREHEEVLRLFVPNSHNSEVIYLTVSSKYEIRREIFLFIKALANSTGIYWALAKSAMVVLSGTELGNFNLTNKYIVVENPILLCWSELAKYTPHLIAAVDKYQSLGENAPYCKLIYPSSSLTEFNKSGLKIFATIAREIAILEGVDSFKNYEGTTTNPSFKRVIDKALWLVKAFGGANTKVTQEVRDNLLANESSNKDLLHELTFGAHITKTFDDDSGEEESEDENIAA